MKQIRLQIRITKKLIPEAFDDENKDFSVKALLNDRLTLLKKLETKLCK